MGVATIILDVSSQYRYWNKPQELSSTFGRFSSISHHLRHELLQYFTCCYLDELVQYRVRHLGCGRPDQSPYVLLPCDVAFCCADGTMLSARNVQRVNLEEGDVKKL